MSTKDDKIIELLVNLHEKTTEVEAATKIQAVHVEHISESLSEIKSEQSRQNTVVEEHQRRSTASEGRLQIVEDQHKVFSEEHKVFKDRMEVAEQPGIFLKTFYKGLITLGTGAGAMYGILKLLDFIK